jgi:hypothetical protein
MVARMFDKWWATSGDHLNTRKKHGIQGGHMWSVYNHDWGLGLSPNPDAPQYTTTFNLNKSWRIVMLSNNAWASGSPHSAKALPLWGRSRV